MSNNEISPNVVIIGSDHYNTYGIVRSLGEKGIKSEVLILGCRENHSFVLQSKYIEKGLGCLTLNDALLYLKNRQGDVKRIVICCSDEAEEFIIAHYDELSPRYCLPVCADINDTVRLMHKDSITDLAKQFGIITPNTWTVINRDVPEGVLFPCITKPLISTSGHKNDIVICRNKIELLAVVKDEQRCADYVVQEYIEFDKEISVLGVVLANGDVFLSGCIDKLRTCMIGTTSFGMMVDNSLLGDIVNKLESMMKSTGYIGLFSAEFVEKDGIYYFLEVNFRNDGNTYVATASGQNFPFKYVQSFTNEEIEYDKPSFPCYFMLDIEDFLALRHNHVSIEHWKRDFGRADVCLVYNKKDIKPFVRKIRTTLFSIARRLLKRMVSSN